MTHRLPQTMSTGRLRGTGAVRVNNQEPPCQLPPLTLNPAEPPFMGISPFFFSSFPFQL